MPASIAFKSHRRTMLAIGVSLSAIAIPQVASAQSCTPDATTGLCEQTVTTADQSIAISSPTRLINLTTGTGVTQTTPPSPLVLENRAGASLNTTTLLNPGVPNSQPGLVVIPRIGAVLINGGTVDGDVILRGATYIAAGGTVTGSVKVANPAAISTEYFIDRSGGNLGVAGQIDPGAGLDLYVQSYSASAEIALPSALPSNFELRGLEVLGAGTTVTVSNPDGADAVSGLALTGTGSIVNRAIINNISFAGTGIPDSVIANIRTRAVNYGIQAGETGLMNLVIPLPSGLVSGLTATTGSSLNSFTNEGTINGDIGLNTAYFVNLGTINLLSNQTGTLVQGSAVGGLTFINRGEIRMANSGLRQSANVLTAAITATTALDAATGRPLSFLNDSDALIEGGVILGGQASVLRFENRGEINRDGNANLPNTGDSAVSIGWSDFGPVPIGQSDFRSESVELLNSGTIDGGIQGNGSARAVTFLNTGSIANAGLFDRAVELSVSSTADAIGNPAVVDGETFAFSNTGSISGAVDLDLEVSTVTVGNSGTITVPASLGLTTLLPAPAALVIDQETVLGSSLDVTNSGTIESAGTAGAAMLISAEAGDIGSGVAGAEQASASVTVNNSGTLRTTGGAFVVPGPLQGLPQSVVTVIVPIALGVELDAEGAGTLTINNAAGATIETVPGAVLLANPNGAVPLANMATGPAIVTVGHNVAINNDGTIRTGNLATGAPLSPEILSGQTRISYAGYGPLEAARFEGVTGGAIDTFSSIDNVTNGASGVIAGGIALRDGNDTLLNNGRIDGNVFMGTGNDCVTNLGTIAGNVSLGDGNDIYITSLKDFTVRNNGVVDGGQGGDTLIMLVNEGGSLQDYATAPRSNFEFVALGGDGTVTSTGEAVLPVVQLAGSVTLAEGSVVNAGQTFAFRSDGTVPLNNTLTNLGTIDGSVALGLGNDAFANYGTMNGSLELGDGDDRFIQRINATFTGTADGGAGRDTFTLDITGGGRLPTAIYDQLVNFEVLGLTGTGTIVTDAPLQVETIELASNGGTVSFGADSVVQTQGDTAITGTSASDTVENAGTINGNVDLGDGDNDFFNNGTTNGDFVAGTGSDNLANAGTIAGSVDLGDGDNGFVNEGTTTGNVVSGNGADSLSNAGSIQGGVATGAGSDDLENAGAVAGSVDTGQGDDSVTNTGTIGGDVNLDGTSVPVEEQAPQARASSIRLAAVTAEVVPVTGGDDTFTNSGSIGGSVNAGAGNDSFTLSGSVAQNVDLGDGNDILDLQGAWAIGGIANGGDGTDILRLGSDGTEAEPRVLELAQFQSFEQLDVASGVNKLTGTGTFNAISVHSGRLIGAAGSVIAGDVTVAAPATFGSAGTVTGNITVAGVLSPGASPATMTVNGNVSLGATSNSVFEFTPTVSDALVINGSLIIASGARLTMTGTRPITPGVYTLVSTTQGITGSFGTNITRDDTILGVLRQTAKTIELVGLFQLQGGANVQATAAKDYLNALLISGQASNGVIDAFPSLLDADGFARAAQLQTLTPEPYADAAQLGIENGLSIARALRAAPLTGRGENSGLFVFGQGYGSWRNFAGDARGVARADVDSYGYLGGLGYGNDTFGVSLFVGRSDSRQRIAALGARNDADGLFAGGRLHFALDGVTAGASIVFDRAEGNTSRNPAVGGAARSHYALHGTTADAWIGYGASIGGGWRVGPEVGVTSVSVTRGGIVESGGGAFGLGVAREHYDAVFLNGSLKLQGPQNGRFRPWIAAGVRHRTSGDPIAATASLTGTTTSFKVGGVERDRTLPYASAGLAFDLGAKTSVYVNGDAEFSETNASQNLNAGIVFRF